METIIKINNLNINSFVEGKGQPIVFIHGLGGSINNWQYTFPYFLEKGYQVLALDLPGYWKSSKPRIKYTIPFYANIVKDFINYHNLKQFPIIVGNSMGGHIGIYFAAKYKSRLKALVLVDSSGLNELNPFEGFLINMTFDKNNIGTILKYMIDFFSRNIFYDPNNPGSKSFIDEQKIISEMDDYSDYCHAIEESVDSMLNYPIKDILTEIKVPVKIIWGSNDRLVPVFYAHRFHNLIPGSKLRIIEKCGHVPELEKPDIFNQILHEYIEANNLKTEKNSFSLIDKFKKLFYKYN